jgi:hypothetical protein
MILVRSDRNQPKKAGFFSPIRTRLAIAKNGKNTGCLVRRLGYSVFATDIA